MRLKTKAIATALMLVCGTAIADTISDAIARQDSAEAASIVAASNAEKKAIESATERIRKPRASADVDFDAPELTSVLAMGGRYVLKFSAQSGRYIVTAEEPEIGSKWRLVKAEGLSAVIQRGKDKPVRVRMSVPDDVEKSQSMNAPDMSGYAGSMNTAMPPQPPRLTPNDLMMQMQQPGMQMPVIPASSAGFGGQR